MSLENEFNRFRIGLMAADIAVSSFTLVPLSWLACNALTSAKPAPVFSSGAETILTLPIPA